MNRFWTFRYTLLNMTYFVAFCTIHALAAVYLLANGFTNTEVGILLAVANILSAVLQPIIIYTFKLPSGAVIVLFAMMRKNSNTDGQTVATNLMRDRDD